MKYLLLIATVFSSQVFANIHSGNTWRHYEITTCFAAGEEEVRDEEGYKLKVRDWSEASKEKIKNWVNEEFTPEKTNIHFTGFNDCEENKKSDVIIFYNKDNRLKTFWLGGIHGLALLGPRPGDVKNYPRASSFVSISHSGMNKGTVVHEFGHVLGLAHEHDHPDAYLFKGTRCKELSDHFKTPHFGFIYEPFDKDSVMNYCRIHGKGGKTAGLSEGDLALIKRMYP